MGTLTNLYEKLPKRSVSQGMRYYLYQSTLNHLEKLASTNGWKAHAWYRAQELEQHPLGIFKGISQELMKIMNAQNEKLTK